MLPKSESDRRAESRRDKAAQPVGAPWVGLEAWPGLCDSRLWGYGVMGRGNPPSAEAEGHWLELRCALG